MPSSRPATWNPVEYAREVAFRRMADVKVYDDLTLKSKAIPASKDGKGIKVIGAGWSRTATLSMYAAMMELNYKCYHGMEMVITPGLADRWKEVLQRDLAKGNVDGVDWHHVLQGYDAGFDAPFADYWSEIAKAFPDAKVVYTTRDPKAWIESYETAIVKPMFTNPFYGLACQWFPDFRKTYVVSKLIQRRNVRYYKGSASHGGFHEGLIQERLEQLQKEIPPERLLVFHPSQGWEVLCKFLDVPVPETPFPRMNDGPSLAWVLYTVTIIGMSLWVLAISIATAGGLWLYRRL